MFDVRLIRCVCVCVCACVYIYIYIHTIPAHGRLEVLYRITGPLHEFSVLAGAKIRLRGRGSGHHEAKPLEEYRNLTEIPQGTYTTLRLQTGALEARLQDLGTKVGALALEGPGTSGYGPIESLF